MGSWKVALALAIISLLLAFALAAAQEPVRSFDQLDTRLKPGDTVWVTDAQGREIKGKITSLAAEALALKADGSRTFSAADVRLVEERRGDSLLNGGLIGFGIGGVGFGLTCLATIDDQDRGWCALVTVVYGGIGAAAGVAVDALIPGKKIVVYRAPAPGGARTSRLSVSPLVTPRTKGVALSFAF
jgi:hypothetical protein